MNIKRLLLALIISIGGFMVLTFTLGTMLFPVHLNLVYNGIGAVERVMVYFSLGVGIAMVSKSIFAVWVLASIEAFSRVMEE